MVIKVLDLAPSATTTEDGRAVFGVICAALVADRITRVEVSFSGVNIATSSFVNTAFVPLLDLAPLDELKKRVRVVHSNRQINDMIKTRLERESMCHA
jgi:hypothetical protein